MTTPLIRALLLAIDEAVSHYADSHVLDPADVQEIRKDFLRFYVAALRVGLKGVRWNFNGCILCPRPEDGVILHRVLIVEPRVVLAAGGRALGSVACSAHVDMVAARPLSGQVVAAAMRRLNREPPR